VLPGEHISLSVPSGFPPNCEIFVEPNIGQTSDFFTPHMAQVVNSQFTVEHRGPNVIQLKKNCQAIRVRMSSDARQTHHIRNRLAPQPLELRSAQQIIGDMDLSNLSSKERRSFL
jgi:hypothetical protein